MKYLTLTEIEQELKNRDIRVSLDEARKAGLLPKSQRIARKSGGVGSEPAYNAKIIDYLSIINALKSEGYPLHNIRKKLADIIKANSEVVIKRNNVKDVLTKAMETDESNRRLQLVAKALTEIDDLEVDEFSLLEKELNEFDNPETKLRHFLGRNLPEKLRKWQRGQ